MELRALIIQACSEITEDMCRRESTISQFVLKKLPDVMVVIFRLDSEGINLHAMIFLFVCYFLVL
jgi:hypothetical protein